MLFEIKSGSPGMSLALITTRQPRTALDRLYGLTDREFVMMRTTDKEKVTKFTNRENAIEFIENWLRG